MNSLYIWFNNKIDGFSKAVQILASLVSLALGVLLGFASFLLIEDLEVLGILAGSFGGVGILVFLLSITRIIFAGKLSQDIRHNFALSTRRKIAGVSAAAILLSAGALTGGQNPLVGMLLVVVAGVLGIFMSMTEAEKDAIAEMEDEIVWQYEQSQEEN